jgi:preprotein translocase subunit SecF
MQIFVDPKFDYVRWRKAAAVISLIFIGIGAALFFTRGVKLGIDFAGGASVVLEFKDAVPLDRLRAELKDATIQQYGKVEDKEILIRLPQTGKESDYAGQVVESLRKNLNPEGDTKLDLNFWGRDRITDLLATTDPDNKGSRPEARAYYAQVAANIINRRSELGVFRATSEVASAPGVTTGIAKVLNEKAYLGAFNVLNQETVGPQVGGELQRKALWAVVLSTLAMGIYIWFRFNPMFAASAMACIVHDVAVCLTFMLMIGSEFSLNVVSALLLIVGYSINDTVVLYDRVRENRKKLKTRATLEEQLNLAMNQTLSRTILTSGSVFLVLLALLLLGGKVIHDFSWILLIGVISGTYSTLLIVPAVAVAWNNMTGRKLDVAGPVARPKAEARDEVVPQQRKRKAG